MINYEKARLVNGSIYEIVPGDLRENTSRGRLMVIALLGDKALSEVGNETEMAENTAAVTILGASGEEMDIKKGCKYQIGCKGQKGYTVGREVVDKGDLDENAAAEYKDVTVTVMITKLATGDARVELDEAKTQISELNATVDTLLMTNLEK